MPVNLNREPNTNLGKQLLRWSFREFNAVVRPLAWWILAGIVAGLLVAYAVSTANFLFALFIIMAAVLFINETRRSPRHLDCLITATGVAVGKKFWRWSELGSFWIAYHPPQITNLYLVPKNPFDPRVTVPLDRTNPLTVRSLLTKYVSEDLEREDEPTSEALARFLRLQ